VVSSSIKSRVDQAKVIWYPWAKVQEGDARDFQKPTKNVSELSEASAYDISQHVVDLSFNKVLGEASGAFSLTLPNSFDWSRHMKPGEWLTIYLTSEGDLPVPKSNAAGLRQPADLPEAPPNLKSLGNKLRGVCLIQRVSIKSTVSEDGLVEIEYEVSGKDFGVCLEEVDLWFNFTVAEEGKLKAVASQFFQLNGDTSVRNITNLMHTYFRAFFQPSKFFGGGNGQPGTLGEAQQQWLLPKRMLTDMGLSVSGDSYFGNIENLLEFHKTLFENNLNNPISGLGMGSAWARMKELSQPEFHELFSEVEDDGSLKIHFRPIPWAINKEAYPNIGKNMMFYKDLAKEAGEQGGSKVLDGVKNISGFFRNPLEKASKSNSTQNFRKNHRVSISSSDIFSFDVGPDFHSRYNHFLITVNNLGQRQLSFLYSENFKDKSFFKVPFRNDGSIKRHGLRARHFDIMSYLTQTSGIEQRVFEDPNQEFMLEVNEVMRDFWGQAGDFYSGTFNLVGRNDVKIGKVLVTDSSVRGVANFVFYIESYTDRFVVSDDGVGEWTQTVAVTRGAELEDLEKRSGFKDKQPIERVGSFVKNV
jgi:hypothetical protein